MNVKKVIVEHIDSFVLGDQKQLIKQLMEENRQLKQQIAYITGQTSEALELEYYEKHLVYKHIKRNIKPKIPPYEPNRHFKFITLTFDPTKFGINNDNEKEKLYILHKLAAIIKMDMATVLYGCFEYQQIGSTHAHILLGTNYDHLVQPALKKAFTDNPRNKNAVDYKYARKTAIEYINKECPYGRDKEWFEMKQISEIVSDILPVKSTPPIDLQALDYGL